MAVIDMQAFRRGRGMEPVVAEEVAPPPTGGGRPRARPATPEADHQIDVAPTAAERLRMRVLALLVEGGKRLGRTESDPLPVKAWGRLAGGRITAASTGQPTTVMTAAHFDALTPGQVEGLVRLAGGGELVFIQLPDGSDRPLHAHLRRHLACAG